MRRALVQMLHDDPDWENKDESPGHGPNVNVGITYANEVCEMG